MKESPWGTVQSEEKYGRGLTFVSTPSHGGFMISKGVAERRLSDAAMSLGWVYGSYLCYEEDCAACIVMFELPETQGSANQQDIFNCLSSYYPNYLKERGLEPEPTRYADYLKRQEESMRRRNKDPNLVVAGWGTEGKVKATTADGMDYMVTAESYDKVMFKDRTCNLSEMTIV